MKKILAVCLLLTTVVYFQSACNSNKKGPYTLKMRLAKGDTFSQDINMEMTTNISMMGMSKDMKTDMEIGSDFEVLDSSAAGVDIKMTYTSMNMDMDIGMQGDTKTADSMMKKANQELVGKYVIITLAQNKVVDVKQNMDTLHTSDSTANGVLEKMFSKENLNNMYGMMFNMYPAKPVNINDSWTTANEIDLSGMLMKIDTKYTLVEVKEDIAEINIDAVIDSKGQMSQSGMDFNMDMKGSQKGKFYVKVSDGYVQKGNYEMNVKTEMDVQGQKIPMTIKAVYKVNGD